MFKPIDPYPCMRPPNYNYNVRAPGPYQRSMQQYVLVMWKQHIFVKCKCSIRETIFVSRYYYPFPPVGPIVYHMELSIGSQQFIGKGRTRQQAKHDAAVKALKVMQKEPILQQLPVVRKVEQAQHEQAFIQSQRLKTFLFLMLFLTDEWRA